MVAPLETFKLDYRKYGIGIMPAKTEKRQWQLTSIQTHASPARRESGYLTMVACDQRGIPMKDVELIIGWPDGIAYPVADYDGRFHWMLARSYDPSSQQGPYWAGFVESDIAEEIHGFGIPFGLCFEIKIIFTKI